MGIGMMGFGVLTMLFGLILIVGIVAVTVWAVMHFTGSSPGAVGTKDPQAHHILDQRYARGEINEEEYQRIPRELG